MDEKTIQRIKKLQALAERGVGGEKTTAQKKLAKLLKDRERERLAAVAALLLRCLKVKIYNKTGYVLCKTAKR